MKQENSNPQLTAPEMAMELVKNLASCALWGVNDEKDAEYNECDHPTEGHADSHSVLMNFIDKARLVTFTCSATAASRENRNFISRAQESGQFIKELIISYENLAGIAAEHGPRTLADLMHLQNVIFCGGYIDDSPEESSVKKIALGLPSGSRWGQFIH